MNKPTKIVIRILFIFLVSYLGILGIVYFRQDKMLYEPDKEITGNPQEIGLSYTETSFVTQDGINISGWYIPAKEEKGVVLFCHGNAGNISSCLGRIGVLNRLGLSTLIFDYRGYGQSSGRPSENGTYLDAEAGWDYLINIAKKSPARCIIYGHSLGGAIAAELALRKNPGVLVLEAAFTSVPDFGSRIYPWLPVSLISKYRYATINKIGLIKCPILIIHSPKDEMIPFEYGMQLYEKASLPKEFLEIKGEHNSGFMTSGELYQNGLKSFLDKYIR
jgi:uncharacterized protein